ncbi:MAG: hypothetical protein DMF64_21910 [Acidobacteria bacterium]|nr:MAG: hypothetical protein DMF64_21910 [Acidobacteriota bacterium]
MSSYKFGPFRLDTTQRVLLRAGQPVPLAHKAYEILCVLLAHEGRVVTKDELMQAVWADTFVEEANLAQNIFKLRQALGEVHGQPRYIQTISGRGYRFIAKIKLDEGTADARAVPRARLSSRRAARAKEIDSLAVLPLENMSGAPELEYLSDGLTESLINALSQLPQLRVAARSTVFRFKGQAADPIKLGRELGVQAVLTGRLARLEEQLTLSMELTGTANGTQLWGARYTHPQASVLVLLEAVTREVSTQLRYKLRGREWQQLLKRQTENVAAYRFYLKGRYYWNKRLADDTHRGLAYFRQALDEDPTYALAYVGMADCYDLLCGLSALPPHEGYPKAKAAVLKALELDDDLAEAHASLAHLTMRYDWDWETAEQEYRRALELNPNYATAHHWFATYLTAMGRHEEALVEGRLAQQLNPLSPVINLFIGAHLYFARRYDEAIAHIRKTVESEPAFVLAYTFLAQATAQQGDYEQAFSALNKAQQLSSEKEDISILNIRAYCLARASRKEEACATLSELRAGAAQEYVNPYEIAQTYVALGSHDEAFAWLERAYRERVGDLAFLKVAPELDPLRKDPRFRRLLERINLTD